jgi:hypothetical protein
LERGEVEAINMFEPHTTRLVLSEKYRVLLDFDVELEKLFGAPPLKSSVGMLRETVEKQPDLVKAIRGAYVEAVKMIKAGQDNDFFEAKAKEFFNLSTPEQTAAGMKQNRQNFADLWGESFFESQNKILQSGISLGLLPKVARLFSLSSDGHYIGLASSSHETVALQVSVGGLAVAAATQIHFNPIVIKILEVLLRFFRMPFSGLETNSNALLLERNSD